MRSHLATLLLTLTLAQACAGARGTGLFASRPDSTPLAVETAPPSSRLPPVDVFEVDLPERPGDAGLVISYQLGPRERSELLALRVCAGKDLCTQVDKLTFGPPSPLFFVWLPPGAHELRVQLAHRPLSGGQASVREVEIPVTLERDQRARLHLELSDQILVRSPSPTLTVGVRTQLLTSSRWKDVAVRPHRGKAGEGLSDLIQERDPP